MYLYRIFRNVVYKESNRSTLFLYIIERERFVKTDGRVNKRTRTIQQRYTSNNTNTSLSINNSRPRSQYDLFSFL